VLAAPSNVRVWRQSGKQLVAMSISHFDPIYGPAAFRNGDCA
jgi:hypothetical protein